MFETNLLEAICNLSSFKRVDLLNLYSGSNRVNNMGMALEYYIKDLFCDTINVSSVSKKDKMYSNYLSYIGNQNNPPDFIIKAGDSVEVKKLEGLRSGLALNSSYPKSKLHVDCPMITKNCRICEEWSTKDIIYSIGVVDIKNGKKLKLLWFLYGDCYAATRETYEKIRTAIRIGFNTSHNINTETKELGRVNAVDPLGITYLRIRGMWHIDNPIKVFDYIDDYDKSNAFTMYAIMREEKYDSFPNSSKNRIKACKQINIKDIEIKNPDNPAKFIEAKLIKFIIQ